MRSVDLVSREWCDLVFEGRNQSYGAYRLRQEAGRRYWRALMAILFCLTLSVGSIVGLNLYLFYGDERDMNLLMEEMKRMEAQQNPDAHLLKFVDSRPKIQVAPKKVVVSAPEIVEEPTTEDLPELIPEEALLTEQIADTLSALVAIPDSVAPPKTQEPPPLVALTPTEVVQEMPEFPGGITALMLWLDRNIIYPPLVIQQKVKGTTYLTFLVDKEGSVIEPEVEEPLHPMISAAIMRAARSMPKWEPGKMNGQVSIVRVTIPIEYHL